jgi:hypothetical protein
MKISFGTGEPAGEIALKAVQIGPAAAVADMAVGADEVLRRPLDSEPGGRPPVGVVQAAGRGVAGESVHFDEAGVALAERGEPVAVPAVGGPAKEKVEAGRGQGFLQPAGLSVAGDPGVGESIPGFWPSVELRLSLLDGGAVPVVDAELGEGRKPYARPREKRRNTGASRGVISVRSMRTMRLREVAIVKARSVTRRTKRPIGRRSAS